MVKKLSACPISEKQSNLACPTKGPIKGFAQQIAVIVGLVVSISACGEPEVIGDPSAGAQKSAICGQCHGQDGISIIPIYPNLAGQKQGYMELQLKAFRSGQRLNAAMTPHAKRLSDQDIADLSAYYAELDPRGKQ